MISRTVTTTGEGGEILSQTQRDVSWDEIRSVRREWFERTDLWMLADRFEGLSEENKTALRDFRQQMRELPQTHADDPNAAADAFPTAEEWF